VALGFSNGGSLIAMAAGGTGVIFFSLAGVATVTRKDFSFMGKFLFIGMIVVLLAALANIFFQIPALSLTISAIAVMIFSAYILYDISRIVTAARTTTFRQRWRSISTSTTSFVSLLNLLMVFSGDRD
jgi:modulator of FtsH protease